MKNKGFTLVELLGVLIILAILGILVSQVIIDRVKESNQKMEKLAKDIIISSARDYIAANSNSFVKTIGKTYCITYSSLLATEYLNDGMVPQIDEVSYLQDYYVKAKYNGNSFDYEMVADCTPN